MIMFNIYLTLKLNTIIFVLIIKYSIFVLLHQIFNIMELRIKEICKEKGILQKELADKIGVTDIALRASLKGNPTVGTLEKVAKALDVTITELFAAPNNELYGLVKYKGLTYKIDSREALENLLNTVKSNL